MRRVQQNDGGEWESLIEDLDDLELEVVGGEDAPYLDQVIELRLREADGNLIRIVLDGIQLADLVSDAAAIGYAHPTPPPPTG